MNSIVLVYLLQKCIYFVRIAKKLILQLALVPFQPKGHRGSPVKAIIRNILQHWGITNYYNKLNSNFDNNNS